MAPHPETGTPRVALAISGAIPALRLGSGPPADARIETLSMPPARGGNEKVQGG